MDNELDQVLDLARQGQWILVGALLIGAILRVFKPGTKWTPKVPEAWRPWFAIALGLIEGVARSIVNGTPWKKAILEGLAAAFTAMAGHNLLVESLRGGRELGESRPSVSAPIPAVKEGVS